MKKLRPWSDLNFYTTYMKNSHFELNGITVMHLVDNLRSKSVIQKLNIPYVGDKALRMQGKERKVCVYQLTFVASE